MAQFASLIKSKEDAINSVSSADDTAIAAIYGTHRRKVRIVARVELRASRKPRGLRFTARVLTRLLRLLPITLAATRLFKAKVINRPTSLVADGPVIVAANHRSFSDPIYIWGALRRPAVFVAMAELWKWPLVGWIMRLMGHIPVNRKDPTSRTRVIEFGQQVLDASGALVIFPEGKMYDMPYAGDRVIGPLFDGVVRLAFATDTPVLVCGLQGTSEVYPPKKGAKLNRRQKVHVRFASHLMYPRNFLGLEGFAPDPSCPSKQEIDLACSRMLLEIERLMEKLVRQSPTA